MKLKKFMFALVGMTLIYSFPTMSNQTGTLFLRGSIPLIISIKVRPTNNSFNLDLTTDQTDLLVAEVDEISNSSTGHKILLSSQNGGRLLNSSGSDNFVYSAKYDGAEVSLSSDQVEIKNVPNAVPGESTSEFRISYTGKNPATIHAGDYKDNLTFTILAN